LGNRLSHRILFALRPVFETGLFLVHFGPRVPEPWVLDYGKVKAEIGKAESRNRGEHQEGWELKAEKLC
jgi:hypothetical protein